MQKKMENEKETVIIYGSSTRIRFFGSTVSVPFIQSIRNGLLGGDLPGNFVKGPGLESMVQDPGNCWLHPALYRNLDELTSKLRISTLIAPIILAYTIPHTAPFILSHNPPYFPLYTPQYYPHTIAPFTDFRPKPKTLNLAVHLQLLLLNSCLLHAWFPRISQYLVGYTILGLYRGYMGIMEKLSHTYIYIYHPRIMENEMQKEHGK